MVKVEVGCGMNESLEERIKVSLTKPLIWVGVPIAWHCSDAVCELVVMQCPASYLNVVRMRENGVKHGWRFVSRIMRCQPDANILYPIIKYS